MDDEHDKLWEVLGRARKPVISPFFAANVLREIRQSGNAPAILEWLRERWRLSAAAVTALLVLGFAANHWREESRDAAHDSLLAQVATNPDYDLINHLDELVAYQETSLWLDSSAEQF